MMLEEFDRMKDSLTQESIESLRLMAVCEDALDNPADVLLPSCTRGVLIDRIIGQRMKATRRGGAAGESQEGT